MEFLQVILTSLLSFSVLFLLAKFMGKRQMSELSMFDYINGITIGSIAAELVVSPFSECYKPLTGMVVYTAAVLLLSFLSDKSMRLRRLIEGESLLLLEEGKVHRENLRRAKLDLNEFLLQCRESGYFDLSELACAILEPNGRISFLPKSSHRPYTPEDAGLTPAPARRTVNVIADGRVLTDNLTAAGFDRNWLDRRLHAQGIGSPGDVLLGYINAEGKLTVFLDAAGRNSRM